MKPKILVLTGDGINSEVETSQAFNLAGGESSIIHINEWVEYPELINQFDILALPGGFSHGDHLGSGKILSLKIKNHLLKNLQQFINHKNPIIGICNGFQVLMQLGLLPYTDQIKEKGEPLFLRSHGLTQNRQKEFINRWVKVHINKNSPCIWTEKLIEREPSLTLDLPIRHGEGAVVGLSPINHELIPLFYDEDVNGSQQKIAAICDESGLIFGMMPHPEVYLWRVQHPYWGQFFSQEEQKGPGLLIFESAIQYIQKKKAERRFVS